MKKHNHPHTCANCIHACIYNDPHDNGTYVDCTYYDTVHILSYSCHHHELNCNGDCLNCKQSYYPTYCFPEA